MLEKAVRGSSRASRLGLAPLLSWLHAVSLGRTAERKGERELQTRLVTDRGVVEGRKFIGGC